MSIHNFLYEKNYSVFYFNSVAYYVTSSYVGLLLFKLISFNFISGFKKLFNERYFHLQRFEQQFKSISQYVVRANVTWECSWVVRYKDNVYYVYKLSIRYLILHTHKTPTRKYMCWQVQHAVLIFTNSSYSVGIAKAINHVIFYHFICRVINCCMADELCKAGQGIGFLHKGIQTIFVMFKHICFI